MLNLALIFEKYNLELTNFASKTNDPKELEIGIIKLKGKYGM